MLIGRSSRQLSASLGQRLNLVDGCPLWTDFSIHVHQRHAALGVSGFRCFSSVTGATIDNFALSQVPVREQPHLAEWTQAR
jgi:hypothetical protein